MLSAQHNSISEQNILLQNRNPKSDFRIRKYFYYENIIRKLDSLSKAHMKHAKLFNVSFLNKHIFLPEYHLTRIMKSIYLIAILVPISCIGIFKLFYYRSTIVYYDFFSLVFLKYSKHISSERLTLFYVPYVCSCHITTKKQNNVYSYLDNSITLSAPVQHKVLYH